MQRKGDRVMCKEIWRSPDPLTLEDIERWYQLLKSKRKKDTLRVPPKAVYHFLATIADIRQQRDAANGLLMKLAEETREAISLLRDYARIYPNNSGRTIRFLKRMDEAGWNQSPTTGKAP